MTTTPLNNSFKSTSIHGTFQNIDYPDTSVLADGYFQRNLKIDGNLNINSLTLNEIDESGNVLVNTSGLAMKSYVDTQINSLIGGQPNSYYDTLKEISDYIESDVNLTTSLTNSIAIKQAQLIQGSTIPNLKIQDTFSTRSPSNTVLSLDSFDADSSIKFLINALPGSINANVGNFDSVIYAHHSVTNRANLVLTTSSTNSLAFIKINVNNIWLGGIATDIKHICTNIINTVSSSITNTCPNVNYSSLPKCSLIPSLNDDFVNKLYVDSQISNIDLSPYLTSSALSGYATSAYVDSQISNIDLSPYLTSSALTNYATSAYVDSQISNIDLSTALASKQDLIVTDTILPRVIIQEQFSSNHGLNNRILELENTATGHGIKFVINSNNQSGVTLVNENIGFRDSVIYAVSPLVNQANLTLTTFSANNPSLAFLRMNVNQIWYGGRNVIINQTSAIVINTIQISILTNCPNVVYSSLPRCDITISPDLNQLINRACANAFYPQLSGTNNISANNNYTGNNVYTGYNEFNNILPSTSITSTYASDIYSFINRGIANQYYSQLSGTNTIIANNTYTGDNVYSASLPTCSIVPSLNNQLVNKLYVDSEIGSINLSPYLTTSTLNDYLVSGNLQTIYSSNVLLLSAGSNTILRVGGVENLYMNSTGIPYCFSANQPSHESHIITKKYLDQEIAKCAKTNTSNTFTSTNTFENDVTIDNMLYMNSAKTQSIASGGPVGGGVLTINSEVNLVLRVGGQETLYMNSTKIPYVFQYPPTHESHVITKKYCDQQTLNVVKTNTSNIFTSTNTFNNDVTIDNVLYLNTAQTESISANGVSPSGQLILNSESNLQLQVGGLDCLWMDNTRIPYVFTYPPTNIDHVVTKRYVDEENVKAYNNAEKNYGGKYNKLPVFVARDIGYQYQTTTLLNTSLTSTETKQVLALTNINSGVYMVEVTVFFKASANNHGFYVEIRQPRYFTTQSVFNIPSLPGLIDPDLPNLPPVQLTPNIPNFPFNSGSNTQTSGVINMEMANASGVFQLSSTINNLMVICKTSLMLSSVLNNTDFECFATSSNGGSIACASMTATRIA